MKNKIFSTLGLVAALFFAAGCNRGGDKAAVKNEHAEHAEHAAGERHEEHDHAEAGEGVTFKEGKGLLIPADTAKFIGLETEDVAEKSVSSSLAFDATVYRAAANAQIASTQPAASKISFATAALDQSQSTNLVRGQAVNVRAKAGPLTGRVSEINSIGGPGATREILVSIDNGKHILQVGEKVSVTVALSKERSAVVIPKSALLKTAEGAFVYTVNGDYFLRAPIKTGVAQDGIVEITDGLYSGDQVVTTPVMTLWMAELQSIRGGKACADGH